MGSACAADVSACSETAELLELLGAVSTPMTPKPSLVASQLASARSCYDHLAGELAIDIYDHLTTSGHLDVRDGHVSRSATGAEFFEELGVDVAGALASKRPTVRPCLDCTQRRHHLAGALGAELFTAMLSRGWIRRGLQPRSVQVTRSGVTEIGRRFASSG